MVLSAISVFAVMLVYVILYSHKRETYAITIYLMTISVVTLIAVMYVSKVGYYSSSFTSDYFLYKTFLSVKLHIKDVSRAYNIVTAMYLASSVILIRSIIPFGRRCIIIFSVPILIFAVINDFEFMKYVYLQTYSPGGIAPNTYSAVCTFTNKFNICIFCLYISAPFAVIATMYFRARIFVNKRYYASLFVSVLIASAYYCYAFIFGTFACIMVNNVNYTKVPDSCKIAGETMSISILLALMMCVLVTITFRFRRRNKLGIIDRNEAFKSEKLFSHSIGLIVHGYKNAFIAMRKQMKLIHIYNQNGNTEAVEAYIQKCTNLVDEQLDEISALLGKLNNVEYAREPVNIVVCIKNVLERLPLPDDISVKFNIESGCFITFAIRSHIEEIFVNVITNAVEAIKRDSKDMHEIVISVITEGDFCEVDINDNGCGITKHDVKNIFLPFYSTKNSMSNGGLGLNYVHRALKAFGGAVKVHSVYGTGTDMMLVFPLCAEKYLKDNGGNNKI